MIFFECLIIRQCKCIKYLPNLTYTIIPSLIKILSFIVQKCVTQNLCITRCIKKQQIVYKVLVQISVPFGGVDVNYIK